MLRLPRHLSCQIAAAFARWRAAMLWTDQETRELIALWPVASAAQIAKRLHRPRSQVLGKARRLRQHGMLAANVEKHFEVSPWPQPARNPARARPRPPPPAVPSPLNMRPCSFGELNDSRCRWPLGEAGAVAHAFCGGTAAPGRPYCPHHWRLAHGHRHGTS